MVVWEVSRRNDGDAKVVLNGDLRRKRSVSVERHHISDSESVLHEVC
ncbi:hypothetical protein Hanom_Chr12g01174401 [Helianthus anomalus]